MKKFMFVAVVLAVLCMPVLAQEDFKASLGQVSVSDVSQGKQYQIPYIFWGADMATFYANGGLTTQPGSIYNKLGLDIKLFSGDDFRQQTKDYLNGKTPFLRGVFTMLGMASEAISQDARTKGMVVMQLSWSTGGDCLVGRDAIKTVKDLRGKTIVLQKDGPHVGFLDDVLKVGQLSWDDVKLVWVNDITGKNGPAEYFKKHAEVDACFVVSPDMASITGGLTSIGTGTEGTIKGARVVVSTAEMTHSIADMYICRKDFYDKNRDFVTKFVAGNLKAQEELVELKKKYEQDPKGSPEYSKLLRLAQDIFGKESIPTLEDAHGLFSDCTLVGYPGQIAFFQEKNNLHGFDALQKSALDLATGQGYASVRSGLFPSSLDYESSAFLGYLAKTNVKRTERFKAEAVQDEIEKLSSGGGLGDRTIDSFTINFAANQQSFSVEQYGSDFERAVRNADKAGGAVMMVRGHADPTKALLEFVNAGLEKKILQKTGSSAQGWKYFFKGNQLDLNATRQIVSLIESGEFDGVPGANPRETMQAALNLSKQRAEAVRKSVIEYAKSQGITIDLSQIQAVGAGILEPLIPKPRNPAEAEQNMRVEFRLVRVTAEAMTKSDFDF